MIVDMLMRNKIRPVYGHWSDKYNQDKVANIHPREELYIKNNSKQLVIFHTLA